MCSCNRPLFVAMLLIVIMKPLIAQQAAPVVERGLVIGIAPGFGMASPMKSVYESGIQTGISFCAKVGYRFNHRFEIALEPLTCISGLQAVDNTPDMLSDKIERNAFLFTVSFFPFSKNNFFAKTGCGLAAYISYNKPAPDPSPVSFLTTGNWGNNDVGYMAGCGYEFRMGKVFCMDAGVSYLYSNINTLLFEGFPTTSSGKINLVTIELCCHILARLDADKK